MLLLLNQYSVSSRTESDGYVFNTILYFQKKWMDTDDPKESDRLTHVDT